MKVVKFILTFVTVFVLYKSYGQIESPTIIRLNGKYGIVDFNGNMIVDAVCDTIYSYPEGYKRIGDIHPSVIYPFFVMKQKNKYAYAYYSTNDHNLRLFIQKDQWHWEVSDFIYDSLQPYDYEKNDPYLDVYDIGKEHRGTLIFPPFSMKFLKEGKWGIMYSMYNTARDSRMGSWLCDVPTGFAKLSTIEAKYDSVGERSIDQTYITIANGKYGLLFAAPPHKTVIVDNCFDTISSDKHFPALYRGVKKDNKWGVIRLNYSNGEWEYIVPCLYNSPPEAHRGLYAYTDSSTVIYDYRKSGKIIELKLVKDKDYKDDTRRFNFIFKYFCFFIFESKFEYPDCINSGTGEVRYYNAYNIVVVDTISNQVIKSFISSKDTLYSFYSNTQYSSEKDIIGILIGKKVKSETGLIEYFQDFESDELKFSIDLSREGYENCHCYSNRLYECCDNMPVVNYKERKNGERKKVYVGYYNFETKTYKKGKCQSCR